MNKTQILRMHTLAPTITAFMLRHTTAWETISRHYNSKTNKFRASIEEDDKSMEALMALATSIQRTKGIGKAKSIADALTSSPHFALCRILDRVRTWEQYREAVKTAFPGTGYAGNPAALLALAKELKWNTNFKLPDTQPAKEPKTKAPRQTDDDIESLRKIVARFAMSKTGATKKELLALASLMQDDGQEGEQMSQFHDTGYGRRFFDQQLPRATEAIENLTKAIKERPQDETIRKIAAAMKEASSFEEFKAALLKITEEN